MKKLSQIIAQVLEIDEKKVNDRTSPENTSTWDSYNALLLVSELEDNYKVKFTLEEIVSVKSVKDIKTALKKHGVKKI